MALALAPGGWLWVTRTMDGVGPGAVDVLGGDGAYQGSFALRGVVSAFLSDSLFIGVDLDPVGTGKPRSALYRVPGSATQTNH